MIRIKERISKVVPKNNISRSVGKIASSRISRVLIKPYSKFYKIDLSDVNAEYKDFNTLNEFFTRKLSGHARPIDQEVDSLVSPVDGTISQIGDIVEGKLIQAKEINYELKALVGNEEKAAKYKNGKFITIYLSPSDYHRIHMPTDGIAKRFDYFPGKLFPVNKIGVNHVNGLFTKNERIVTEFECQNGLFSVVKVGAFIVGSVQVDYYKDVQKMHRGKYVSAQIHNKEYKKGEEIGHFQFGSTVILLFSEGFLEFSQGMENGMKLKVGQKIAELALLQSEMVE